MFEYSLQVNHNHFQRIVVTVQRGNALSSLTFLFIFLLLFVLICVLIFQSRIIIYSIHFIQNNKTAQLHK